MSFPGGEYNSLIRGKIFTRRWKKERGGSYGTGVKRKLKFMSKH
jgi:hypothetical protein